MEGEAASGLAGKMLKAKDCAGAQGQAGHRGKSPKSSQEPRQDPPASSPSYNLLGNADLWEASPPHTLWLPKLTLSQHLLHCAPSTEGDRSAAGPQS